MDNRTRYLARRANRVALGLGMLLAACFLNGCSYAPPSTRTPIERLDFQIPVVSNGVSQGLPLEDFDQDFNPAGNRNEAKLGLSEDAAKALGCGVGDRFDRSAALAYNFDDRQSRLALHLSIDGPSFSDPARIEFNSVVLRYTHKFSKPPEGKREKCRFQSNLQGVLGSAYNELFMRNNYPVWKEIKSRLNLKK